MTIVSKHIREWGNVSPVIFLGERRRRGTDKREKVGQTHSIQHRTPLTKGDWQRLKSIQD